MSKCKHPEYVFPPAGGGPRHLRFSALVQHLLATCEREENIIESICRAATDGETATVQALAVELATLRNSEASRDLLA